MSFCCVLLTGSRVRRMLLILQHPANFPDSVHFRRQSKDWLSMISAGNTWIQNKFHPFLFSLIFITFILSHIYPKISKYWTLKIQRWKTWSLLLSSSKWNWADIQVTAYYGTVVHVVMTGYSMAWYGMAWHDRGSWGAGFCHVQFEMTLGHLGRWIPK